LCVVADAAHKPVITRTAVIKVASAGPGDHGVAALATFQGACAYDAVIPIAAADPARARYSVVPCAAVYTVIASIAGYAVVAAQPLDGVVA
jgi:hypothetical protein